jgi:hypothetical protein|tara:strand:- start:885 stop:1388 length:504 start_codon:yes stop_codon:yes gene_type:complete
MESELKPIYTNNLSFYGKAVIEETNNKKTLKSYNTKVCFIENNKAIVTQTYSQTTLRHIKEFLKQNGFKAETKKQILNDYKPSKEENEKREEENEKREEENNNILKLVCKMGEVLNTKEEDKNNFKKRMLKARFGEGLNFPNDWDSLSESDKKYRLDTAIKKSFKQS